MTIDARESTYGGYPVHSGKWTVTGGTGSYESVTSTGEFSGECLGGIDCSWTYAGDLEISK